MEFMKARLVKMLFTHGGLMLLLSVSVLHAGPPRTKSPQQDRVLDVAMNKDAILEGHLIDPFGNVLKNAPVSVIQNQKVVWKGRTDAHGRFEVKGLPSGVYRVNGEWGSANCRVWTSESAPPRALKSLLLTRDSGAGNNASPGFGEDLTIRVSGFSTFTLPKPVIRDVRQLISP